MFKQSATLTVLIAAIALQFTACHKDKDAPKPTVKFLPSTTSAVTGTTVTFTNQSSDADSYLWKFGDGSGSVSTNATHQYDSIGSFKVTLIAIGKGGTDSTSLSIGVKSGNITILEGTGIKAMSIGSSWNTIKAKYGTDTAYYSTYIATYGKYLNEVAYASEGIIFIFASTTRAVSSVDVTGEILVLPPYAGTTQRGVAVGNPMGYVSVYYGMASSSTTSTDKTITSLNYPRYGVDFLIQVSSNRVLAVDVYKAQTSKAGSIFDNHNFASLKK